MYVCVNAYGGVCVWGGGGGGGGEGGGELCVRKPTVVMQRDQSNCSSLNICQVSNTYGLLNDLVLPKDNAMKIYIWLENLLEFSFKIS